LALSPLAARYDQIVLDLDGCVWIGDEPTPGAVEAIGAVREAGKRVAFVTNNARLSGEDYVRKLWSLGVQASLGDVVTAAGAMQHRLSETLAGRTAFVVGAPALRESVEAAGLRVLNETDLASRAEVVVVGGTDDFVYDDLKNACLALRRGAEFLATSRDPTHPRPDGLWPGVGALLAAVERGSAREASIVGKPEPQLFLTAIDRLGEGRTLAVGDRLDTDILAASRAGLDAALVLSGGASREEAETGPGPRPVAVAENLSALLTR